ncbi:MAG TPA: NAD(P)-dependent alcohol dehydrogenase [Kofleriaceae bacterium]|nr:NAD(P)-dependent alcohol dehydrogenase [Kofleriaceae bacterium]
MHAPQTPPAAPAPAAVPAPPSPAAAAGARRTMRAIVGRRYGTPDVLTLEEIERPAPGAEDVLVRVHAAGASIGDHHVITGKPYLIRLSPYGGIPRPRNLVPGTALAGRVEAVGAKVTAFAPGDEVFGEATAGAFAEYAAVPAARLAKTPRNLPLEDAAAVPWGVTALQGLRDAGRLAPGQRVLVNGASGGVGTWAIQIAKALGAEVTAVCSTRNVDLVRALGADAVIDYTSEDFVAGGPRFDLMLDNIGNRPLSDCAAVLKPRGTYVSCSGGGGDWVGPLLRLAAVHVRSLFTRKRLTTFLTSSNQRDLEFLRDLVEAGKAKPVIERRLPLSEVGAALRHIGEGHARGQTIIQIA